jgi:hypothetical protein
MPRLYGLEGIHIDDNDGWGITNNCPKHILVVATRQYGA